MPVDVFKRFIPKNWSAMPFFRQTDELEGIPVRAPKYSTVQ
jgi:15-cis-phytoene desaturase